MEPVEIVVGLYEMENTTGKSIFLMLKDVLTRLNLPLNKLRGQSYDGAANMSGQFNDVQSLFLKEAPLVYYTHCGAHRCNLVAKQLGICN